jgi:hypothetical protein
MHRRSSIQYLCSIVLGLVAGTAHAETRFILVEISALYPAPRTVNIYSEEPRERRMGVSVPDAASALRAAPNWKSTALVEILFHGDYVDSGDMIALLEGIKGNSDLALSSVGHADSTDGRAELKKFRELSHQ